MSELHHLARAGYLVLNPAHGLPTVLHHELETAVNEARRLSAANPGQTFIVLNTVGAFHLPKPGPQWLALEPDDRSIPFRPTNPFPQQQRPGPAKKPSGMRPAFRSNP